MASGTSEEEQKKRNAPPPLEFLKPGEAQAPLPPRDQPAAWVPRPEEFQPPQKWGPAPMGPPPASNLPKIAGVLLLLAAAFGMAGAVYSALTLPSAAEYAAYLNRTSPAVVATLQVCGLISIWSQAMALLGAVMAFQRMNWKLTFVCAIFSLLTLGIVYFEGSLLGLFGLILVVRSRRYFLT